MPDRWSPILEAAGHARLACPAAEGLVGLPLVEALLADRGYEVTRLPGSNALLGGAWAALFPEMELAVCDQGLGLSRQAFALAHEFGHLVLHASGHGCGAGEIDPSADAGDSMAGALEVYNPRQWRELEANVFALHLLLPRAVLWNLFVEQGLGAGAIAARLGVSYAATLNALAGLLRAGTLTTEVRRHGGDTEAVGAHGGASTSDEGMLTTEAQKSSDGPGEAPVDYTTDRSRGIFHATALAGPSTVEPLLDASQREAATDAGRRVLVQAGPGTGKTATLVGRVLHLIRRRDVDPRRVLVLTFSNRAAGELRARLAAAIGADAGRLTVSTIHGFAYELLRRYGSAIGLPSEITLLDTPAALLLLRAHLGELDSLLSDLGQSISLDRPLGALAGMLEVVSRAKDELIDAAEFARRAPLAPEDETAVSQAASYRWYERVLAREGGHLDYGDLLLRSVRLLREHPAIRAEVQDAYAHLLVDEYQDLNLACSTLLDLLAEGSTLWAVGDPRQSIYRWRGARPEALAAWSGGATTPVLSVNYRSFAGIVRLCGGVGAALGGTSVAEGRALWQAARGPGGTSVPPVVLATAADDAAELDGIARAIQQERDNGRALSEIAVLCSTNAQATAITAGLHARGLPVSRPGRPHDEPAVRQALCLLALAAGDATALLRLAQGRMDSSEDSTTSTQPRPVSPSPLLSPDAALALVRAAEDRGTGILRTLHQPPASLPPDQQQAARSLARFVRSLPVVRRGATSTRATWTSLARYLFDEPMAAARSLLRESQEPALAALDALLSCAQGYDRQPPTLREPSLPLHVRLLLTAGEGLPRPAAAAEPPGVRVLTVHASKGLEFDVVFVPNLARGRFPGRGRSGPAVATGILTQDEESARGKDDRCLFFVALSRARDRLILSRAERYGGRASQPSPLLELAAAAFAAEPPAQLTWTGARQGDQSDPTDRSDRSDRTHPADGTTAAAGAGTIESPALDGALASGLTVDQQALETYLHCPRRYYYAHSLGLPAVAAQGFPHFHQALRRAMARLGELDQPLDEALAARVLDEEWAATHDPHPHEGLYLERARRVVRAVPKSERASRSPGCVSQHQAEYRVDLPAGTVTVQIDRLDLTPGEPPVAARFRTGRPADEHRRETRTALYQAALETAHGGGRVQQEYLISGQVDESQARPTTLQSRLREADEALAGIAAGRFPPAPSDACPECPFWLICPTL